MISASRKSKMTKEQALALLNKSPCGNTPSRVNPSLTEAQAVGIIKDYVSAIPGGELVDEMTEKRVYQVYKNQRRPRY